MSCTSNREMRFTGHALVGIELQREVNFKMMLRVAILALLLFPALDSLPKENSEFLDNKC